MKSAQPNPALTFVFAKDIPRVLPHITSYNGAWKHLDNIKKCLGKQTHQRVSVLEFAQWEGLDAQIVLNQLSS